MSDSFLHFVWTGEYISFVMIVSHSLFFIFSLSVHSSLGYKDAVKCVYERKLLEARTEARKDPQYFLHGDVSKLFLKKMIKKLFIFHVVLLVCYQDEFAI